MFLRNHESESGNPSRAQKKKQKKKAISGGACLPQAENPRAASPDNAGSLSFLSVIDSCDLLVMIYHYGMLRNCPRSRRRIDFVVFPRLTEGISVRCVTSQLLPATCIVKETAADTFPCVKLKMARSDV